jgi:hypothetical protein
MYIGIKEIIEINEYNILIKFTNDEIKQLDMKPFLNKGMYADLVDQDLFNKARISFDTIEWPNGVDVDPEFVYKYSKCDTNEVTRVQTL